MSQAYSARALGSGIASRVRRIETLNLLHDKMLAIMEERGEDPKMAFIPGAAPPGCDGLRDHQDSKRQARERPDICL